MQEAEVCREKGIHVDLSNSSMVAVVSATDTISCSIFTAFSSVMAATGQGQWLLDSGSSPHVTGIREHFSSYVAIATGEQKIRVANNVKIDALGEGTIVLAVWDKRGKQERNLVILGVLHVPEWGRNNLLSVSQLCNLGYYVDFHKDWGVSLRRDDGLGVRLEEVNGLYVLKTRSALKSDRTLAVKGEEEDEEKAASKKAALSHFCLGHLGADAVRKLSMMHNAIPKLPVVPCCVCTGCIYGKIFRQPFPSLPLSSKPTQPLEIVDCDITEPVTPKSLGGALYLLMFTDDFTRFKIGYLMKSKSKALICFKDYKALAEKHHGKPVGKLCTDGEASIPPASSVIFSSKRVSKLSEPQRTRHSRMEQLS